jgi:4-carboxymuconolactone decarboxylase
MRSFRTLFGLLLLMGASVAAGYGLSGSFQQPTSGSNSRSSEAPAATFPKDVYPETGNRLPPIKREELDEAGKKLYDEGGPRAAFGPGRIRLYSPPVAAYMNGVNDYLRKKSGLETRLSELAILVTARELDCEYVWTAHEPQGLEAGLPQETIDIVKYRKSPNALGEKEAVIIELGREAIGKHQVSSGTAARALDLFGKRGLVDVISLMGDYASTAILLVLSTSTCARPIGRSCRFRDPGCGLGVIASSPRPTAGRLSGSLSAARKGCLRSDPIERRGSWSSRKVCVDLLAFAAI